MFNVRSIEVETDEVRGWALKGAEQRLLEIAEEAKAIFRHFPELRGKGRGFDSTDGAAAGQTAKRARRRWKMSAKARKAVGARMRKYWAARRREGQATAAVAATEAPDVGPFRAGDKKPGRRARGPRKMSTAARKRISQAQKARWVRQKGGGSVQSRAVAASRRPATNAGGRSRKKK